MDRQATTKFLTDLLIYEKLSNRKYYAKEVSLDYGTTNVKRIDVMQFIPEGVANVSDIEKGQFICYEIKSCTSDVYSGHGLNFCAEKNYIVTTADTYKQLLPDINSGKLNKYIQEYNKYNHINYGIMVMVPRNCTTTDELLAEIENPTDIDYDLLHWKFNTVVPCRTGKRTRSLIELLFCMLRSKHSYTNAD